ncbi:exonuclease domain-containing protein [Kribbella sp. NPDC049174]|uniref:3'-5' exonuclease n=1 Tax=Kribbella sp. NPDC049174 TaxID=3364112 RepID=UPI003719A54B
MADPRTPWTAFEFAVVDVEGNGQQPPDLVEISIVPIRRGTIGDPKTWLVRPPRPITSIARRIHRITDAQVADAPTVADVADELRRFLDGRVFVAHNAGVDLGVVSRSVPGYQPELTLDTLRLARRLLPGLASYRLGALVESLHLAQDLPAGLAPHRATYDAIVCARLLKRLATPNGAEPLTLDELLDTKPERVSEAETLF